MKVIDVYRQYFRANGFFNQRQRNGALVTLTCTSEEGNVRYEATVTFFPFENDEDYAVSYDAYFAVTVYEASGRRSRKREKELLDGFRDHIDKLAQDNGAVVYWDKPLREAQYD